MQITVNDILKGISVMRSGGVTGPVYIQTIGGIILAAKFARQLARKQKRSSIRKALRK